MKLLHIVGLTVILATQYAQAYQRDKNPIKIFKSERKKAFSPEEQLKTFKLADGFIIELVASEENGVINPIDLTFDDAGRLWTQTAEMYPMDPFPRMPNRKVRGMFQDPNSSIHTDANFNRIKKLYNLETRGTDRVIVIPNPAKKIQGQVDIVVEGLAMPQSILPYKNGVYVAHGTEMLYIEDQDGDGKLETSKSILSGFGVLDTHTLSHTLVRGPGGWVHFSQGAMNLGKVTANASGQQVEMNYSKIGRFSLDGKKVEVVSNGLNNIWGFQLRANGQWYGSEANDKGMSVVPMDRGMGFEGIGNDKLHSYQPFAPQIHKFRVGGTGLSGLAFSEDGSKSFPGKWKDVAFLANPITNTINTVKIDRDATGAIIATHEDDLLSCSDDWFRPVNIEFGPDGCLYIADWYNKIVSHNEIPRDDPSRDKAHGRIWRIRHESQKPASIPNLIKAPTARLIKHLTGETRWEKRAAWHQIADRKATDLIPDLKKLLLNPKASIETKVHAIWAFESLGTFDQELLQTLLQHPNVYIRREAIRSLASFQLEPAQLAALLTPLVDDPHHAIRAQVIRTIEESDVSNHALIGILVESCRPSLIGNNLGGPFERSFERYLARRTLEKYQESFESFLASSDVDKYSAGKMLTAIQALPPQQGATEFVKLWQATNNDSLDKETFVSICSMLSNQQVFDAVEPVFKKSSNFKSLLTLAVETRDRVTSPKLSQLLKIALQASIKSPNPDDQALAMDAAVSLKSKAINKEVTKLISTIKSSKLLDKAIAVLALDRKKNAKVIESLAKDSKLPFNQQLHAIHALFSANSDLGMASLAPFLKGKTEDQIKSIIETLSKSATGSKALIQLVTQKKIPAKSFSLSAAQRVRATVKKNPIAKKILANAVKRDQKRTQLLEQKVDQYVAAVSRLKGDVAKGGAIFQSCLLCHAVGDKGLDIAPALDGSAERELHALMTAIVNPDAAVEGGYHLHRVVRKDGSSVEGYLQKQDEHGITIALMGGSKIFVPSHEIKSEVSVGGKSFMPSTFGDLPEQAMADLITYIKTELKAGKNK